MRTVKEKRIFGDSQPKGICFFFLKEDSEHNKMGKRSPNYLWDSLSLAFSDFIAISVLLMGIY